MVMRVEDVVELEGPACMQIVKMCAYPYSMFLWAARHMQGSAKDLQSCNTVAFGRPNMGTNTQNTSARESDAQRVPVLQRLYDRLCL